MLLFFPISSDHQVGPFSILLVFSNFAKKNKYFRKQAINWGKCKSLKTLQNESFWIFFVVVATAIFNNSFKICKIATFE